MAEEEVVVLPSNLTSEAKSGLGVTLERQVFEAARDGRDVTLYTLLAERSAPEQVKLLSAKTVDDGQITTPLIIASRNGHDKCVHLLLTKFKPDLDQTGTVRFDHFVIEGACALWCASGAGHVNIVKDLIKAGANVNQTTKINSTPLRAACFDGRVEVVKVLLHHGADLHIANQYNNSCLMLAAYKGFNDIVKLLLEKGADPNGAANCGATALHFSAKCGHVDIVRVLFQSGAISTVSENDMTPLLAAAERCQQDVVELIIARPETTRQEKIDALELLGATFANDKDFYDLGKAFNCLKRGMEERWSVPDQVIQKPEPRPRSAYDNRIESRTLDELMEIENDPHLLHMEGLVIRERILGLDNPDLPHPVIFRGAVFADSAVFDKCLSLWLHALRLRVRTKSSLSRDLLRFAQVFSQILHVGVTFPNDNLLDVLEAVVKEIEMNLMAIDDPGPKDDPEAIQVEMEANMNTFLYLLVILTRVKKDLSEDQDFQAMQIVYKAVHLDPRSQLGVGLLHLAVSSDTLVDDFHTNDIVQFPSASATKLLLDAGANATAMDLGRNTPLHKIVAYQKIVTDFATLHAIITYLIEAGAHVDVANALGQTPLDSATTGVAKIILNSQAKLSLKCLAAQSVKKHRVTYQGQVPEALETFIELHGP